MSFIVERDIVSDFKLDKQVIELLSNLQLVISKYWIESRHFLGDNISIKLLEKEIWKYIMSIFKNLILNLER
jgi:hypothetical protein